MLAFEQVYFWDVAPGTEMQGCPSNCTGVILEEGTSNEHKTKTHVLSASLGMLLITELASDVVSNPEQIACFKAPRRITSVLSHGATQWICVGCAGGEVCILQAPFLDPTLLPPPSLTDLESEDEESEDEVDEKAQWIMETREAERIRRRWRRKKEKDRDAREERADKRQQTRAERRTAEAAEEF